MSNAISKIDTMLQVGRTFGMRDGMLRLQYELQRGSGLLSWRMRSVQGWDAWKLERIAPGVRAAEIKAARVDETGTRPFFFDDVQGLGRKIKQTIREEAVNSALAEGERVLRGEFPFFGQLWFNCGSPSKWFRNPVTGQGVSPYQSWTQMRFASPVYGDLKFILEPSRFLFVYPLVRAYALSGDERFAESFWKMLDDWAQQSPPMSGPLWICGQECSLRILAWTFALRAFIRSPSTTDERIALLVSMIAAHAWRTAQTIGYARSQRSNHLVTEAVGLWTAGTLYPELREAQIWRSLGEQLLHEAVIDQITPEGVSQQHSFHYQRMILHQLLWTLRLAELHRAPLHGDIRNRAEAAFDFIREWVDPVSGCIPNYGSDDGSLIFPLTSAAYRDFRPLVQLGASVLRRPALEPGPWDEAALWFGVTPSVPNDCRPITSPSSDSGYFRLGDDKSWAMIRAGHYTRRPFQADQLHVDLWWRGINIASDAGTYLYNGDAPWNNGFAGTAVHNTVTIDGQDQMRRAGRFLWLDWAQASGRLDRSDDRFEGEHDGYRRLGVKHRRRVQWLRDAGWVIVDDIEGAGEHDVRLQWLAPDLPFAATSSSFQVTFQCAQSKISWDIFSSDGGDATVIRAGEVQWAGAIDAAVDRMKNADSRIFGWESPTYGALKPAVSLVYQIRSRLPIRLATAVLTNERCMAVRRGDEVVVLRGDLSVAQEIYRVNLSPDKPHMQERVVIEADAARS
jgi:hypothetical protein